jgi:hypothetical protein
MLWVLAQGVGLEPKFRAKERARFRLVRFIEHVWFLVGGAVVGTGVSRGWVSCFPCCCCCFKLFGCVSGETLGKRTCEISFFRVWVVCRVEAPVLAASGEGGGRTTLLWYEEWIPSQ